MKFIRFLVAALLIAGCAPRGESKTLSEVLDAGKARYLAAKSAKLSDTTQNQLTQLTTKLEGLLASSSQGSTSSADLNGADELLTELISHAGVTARAGMNQLARQFRELADLGGTNNSGAVKLLVGRTYSALGAELETTKFGL